MLSAPEELRRQMVDRLVAEGYVRTPAVAAALGAVPRHLFMPWADAATAYDWQRTDARAEGHPSAPNVVAHWLELATLAPGQNVLEIGASTGYSAALTAHLVGESGRVTSVEIAPLRVELARRRLVTFGCANIDVVLGDGYDGWPPGAPYDRILVTASPAAIPVAWLEQLCVGGILLVPFALRGTHLSLTLRVRRERGGNGAASVPHGVGGVASPIYLFWVGMEGRYPFWAEEPLDLLAHHISEGIARRGIAREMPAPELREPILSVINLQVFALLELEARGVSIAAFNDLPAGERRAVVGTLLERWEELGGPGFWRLQARVQPAGACPLPPAELVVTRGETTTLFNVARG